MTDKLKTIYFAGGCFWGTEHFFRQIQGVVQTRTGYANSLVAAPSYREVCEGHTGAVEAVRVKYDPRRVSLDFLIRAFFLSIDPTSINRQGNDVGPQYRTGIYFDDPDDEMTVYDTVEELADDYDDPVMVEIMPIKNFYLAEPMHQNYLGKTPGGYCHINPALFEYVRHLTPR